jgi:hypothetical protein
MTSASENGLLLEQHLALLNVSAIDPEVIRERGYFSATTRIELRRLGFSDKQARVPALVIPLWSVRGEIEGYQSRPDSPRMDPRRGRAVKYETAAGKSVLLDVPPRVRPQLGDPSIPLWVTEGARKADSAATKGLCCLSLQGVWNWRGSNDTGGKTALADFESIALNERKAYIAFDSDVSEKREVRAALRRLRDFLKSRGADVLIICIPPGAGGAKVGLDDHFAAGGTVEDLLARASPSIPGGDDLEEEDAPSHPYQVTESGFVLIKKQRIGDDVIPVPVPLSNWAARIASNIVRDDGADRRIVIEIRAAVVGREVRSFSVPAAKFAALNWPTEHLGTEAVIYAGVPFGPAHVDNAIRLLSGPPEFDTIYEHTGWREVDGQRVYLHGDGAIGAKGPVEGISVELPSALAGYRLPPPPGAEELRSAIRSSLGILDVAPDLITAPILGRVFRAPLGTSDSSDHISGSTGEGKTELAALPQQFWGAGMDARHLPGSWSSTGNQLEGLAFAAKDALMVIDDFAPGGSIHDVAKIHREADRVLRAQGNQSGRGRANPDGTPRSGKPPRGTILSTGEDIPRGPSLRGRMLIIEVSPGDVRWDRLTACQRAASAGDYARCMSGYVMWLAGHPAVIDGMAASVRALRDQALRKGEGHRRTPGIVANLAYGWRVFLQFAEDVQAITPAESKALWDRAWAALGETAARQQAHQKSADPVRRFIDLLAAALASGRAHVADLEGQAPARPEPWGWRAQWGSDEDGQDTKTYYSQGNRIGWIKGDDLYLEAEAALSAIQELATRQGEALSVTGRTLRKRMAERGLLVRTDPGSESLLVKVTADGARRRVLHTRASLVLASPHSSEKPGQPGQETDDTDGGTDPGAAEPPRTAVRVAVRVEDPNPDKNPDSSNPWGTNGNETLSGLSGSDGNIDSSVSGVPSEGSRAPVRVESQNPDKNPDSGREPGDDEGTEVPKVAPASPIGPPWNVDSVEEVRW